MPTEYEKIKQEYMDKGKSKEEAESIAAATYNKNIRKHKKDKRPVGNKAQQEAGSAVSEGYRLLDDLIIENNDSINVFEKGSILTIVESIRILSAEETGAVTNNPGRHYQVGVLYPEGAIENAKAAAMKMAAVKGFNGKAKIGFPERRDGELLTYFTFSK